MELWIRTQDKETLVKSNIVALKKFDDGCGIINYIGINDWFGLGLYKTKERALEVLNDIQERIKPTIVTTGYECELDDKGKTGFNLNMTPTKTEVVELSTIVYEMPKE